MKKILKLIVAIILAIAVIGGVLFLIDCSEINSGDEPTFSKKAAVYKDGGTIEYVGLGYKIIDFNMLNGYDEVKIGSWFMNYDDFEEEYENFKVNDNVNNEIIEPNEIISGDIINDNNLSGDIIASSGDIISGDILSGDVELENNISGDESDIESISGDNILNEENISGDDEIIDEGYYFNATIIGINNQNLIVQALENEAINDFSDMFSFSLNDTNNVTNQNYLIRQKVRIEYTGTIAESYPAQIDVIGIEIIE